MRLRHRLAAVLAAAAVASGCASNAASSFNPGGVQPVLPPGSIKVISDGGLYVSATIGLSAAAANVLSAIFIAGYLVAANDVALGPPPKMREGRAINLQDCSRPIENRSANLKCATPAELRELETAKPE